jgi:hypothetical protein
MRNLLETNRGWLSNMRIAEALIAAGVQNAASEIERFIVRGETIELRPRIWGECAGSAICTFSKATNRISPVAAR